MTEVIVRIEGLDELVQKLERLERLDILETAMRAAVAHLEGKIKPYPPATIANSPDNPTGRWYERGYGTRWVRRDGSIGGRQTSETLGRQWTTEVRDRGRQGVLGNSVSYAMYVHDAEMQAWFHKARGWKTTTEVAEAETRRIQEFFEDYLTGEIRRLGLE